MKTLIMICVCVIICVQIGQADMMGDLDKYKVELWNRLDDPKPQGNVHDLVIYNTDRIVAAILTHAVITSGHDNDEQQVENIYQLMMKLVTTHRIKPRIKTP